MLEEPGFGEGERVCGTAIRCRHDTSTIVILVLHLKFPNKIRCLVLKGGKNPVEESLARNLSYQNCDAIVARSNQPDRFLGLDLALLATNEAYASTVVITDKARATF